jgi:hypothetical protein
MMYMVTYDDETQQKKKERTKKSEVSIGVHIKPNDLFRMVIICRSRHRHYL